jgi:hypothetical protein
MSYIKYVRAAHLFNFDFILFSSFCVLCPMLLLSQYYPFMIGLLIFSHGFAHAPFVSGIFG